MASSNTFTSLMSIALLSTSEYPIATAFTPTAIQSRTHHKQQHTSLAAPTKATVYYPDGTSDYEDASSAMNDYDIFGYNTPGPPTDTGTIPHFTKLASRLSSDFALTPTLARLASAFSPPGYTFDLANVNDVRCSSLDSRHLEIEAMVCDAQECSSLLVPVTFAEECSVEIDGLEDCILRNVHHLDATTGESILQDREREVIFAEEQEAQRDLDLLQSLGGSGSTSSLPSWWETPHSTEDEDECHLILQLLNGDDFQDMTRGLATYHMLHTDNLSERELSVQSVMVKAVGPEGMMLKVRLAQNVLDVPVRFSDMIPVEYGENGHRSIREKVLTVVSSVDTVTV